jgi:hypothetical protein
MALGAIVEAAADVSIGFSSAERRAADITVDDRGRAP